MPVDLNDPEVKKAIEADVKTKVDAAVEKAVATEVFGLKGKNEELLEKIKKGRALTDAEQTELEEFRKSKATAEEERAIKAGEFDKLKEQIVTKHGEEIKIKDVANANMKASLESHLIDAAAIKAIAEAKGSTTLLLPHVKAHLKVLEVDGAFVARVVNAEGTVRIGDNKGTPMTIEELVATMKKEPIFLAAFEGSGAAGGGAQGANSTQGDNKTMLRSIFDKLDPGAKSAFMADKGKLVND